MKVSKKNGHFFHIYNLKKKHDFANSSLNIFFQFFWIYKKTLMDPKNQNFYNFQKFFSTMTLIFLVNYKFKNNDIIKQQIC